MKLDAGELREIDENEARLRLKQLKRRPLFLILEDVLDTYNIGGLFRLADALAMKKIYLCGVTETPPNHRIKKASVGTYKVVPWEYCKTVTEAVERLRNQYRQKATSSVTAKRNGPLHRNRPADIQFVAIEQDKKSVDYRKVRYSLPLAFVIGNESDGISQETLKLVDHVAEIPMWGINKSLNVIVSAAIVGYHAVSHQKRVA